MVQEHGIHPLLMELELAPPTSSITDSGSTIDKDNDKESLNQITALDVLQRLLESSAWGGDQMKAAYEALVRAAYESLREERNSQKPPAEATAAAATAPSSDPTLVGPTEGSNVTSASNNSDKTSPDNDNNNNNSKPLEKTTTADMMDIDADGQPRPDDTVEPSNNNKHSDQDVLQENANLNASNNSDKATTPNKHNDNNNNSAQVLEKIAAKETENKNVNETEATKEFDYRTRHIALHLCYEGKHYSGLAQNVGMESDNSVERKLFQALQTTRLVQSRETSGYSRCGRTDRGVSAAGQVVALHLKSAIPLNASWDPEGNQPVSDIDDADRFPNNSFHKIQVYVPPKPKKNKNKKHKKNDNNNKSDNDNRQQSDPAVGTSGATTNGPMAGPSTGSTSDPTSAPTASDADLGTGKETKQQQPKRVLKEVSEYPYDKMLNGLLPHDIRILGWCPVSEDFSARFSSKTRTYRYFFVQRNDLNLEAMREGLKLLEGNHDFRNLCKMNVVEVSNFERKIHSAELISLPASVPQYNGHSGLCYFQIQGQAFLWHQIRCIVSVLFMIGRGLESPSVITELLNVQEHPAKPSYPLASEYPLVLHDCGYPNLNIGYSVQNCWAVTCQMEEQWESLVLEAARVRNCLERLKEVDTIRKKELVEFATGRLLERSKKQQRNKQINDSTQGQEDWMSFVNQIKKEQSVAEQLKSLTWGEAVDWLKRWKILVDYNGLRDHIHIPLLQRSKGTTYEEKIEALQQSSTKRSQRFEENAAKKQKSTKESDAQFYEHMLKQGGSGIGPTQGPTAGPTPGPTPEPASGPTAGPTPEPASGTTTGPTPEPASGTTTGSTPEPVNGITTGSSPEPNSGPTTGPTPETSTANPTPEPAGVPTAGPAPGP